MPHAHSTECSILMKFLVYFFLVFNYIVLMYLMEKAMAPHSSTLAWKIHGRRSLVGCSPWGRKESGTNKRLNNSNNEWLESYPEKAMAPHSSTLAWIIPWAEEPGRLQSMGLLRVGHDWATSLSLSTSLHWRRKWQPTPVFLPGESQGWTSLVGCPLWCRTESDTTEAT